MYKGFWTSSVHPRHKSHGRFNLNKYSGSISFIYDGEYNCGNIESCYIDPNILDITKTIHITGNLMITIIKNTNKEISGRYQSWNDSGTFILTREGCNCCIII